MLKIYFGPYEENDSTLYIYDTATFFNNVYEDQWITSNLGKKLIKAIDGSEVVNENVIISPVLGVIDPTKLSHGTKTLLLIAFMDSYADKPLVINATCCGDNCMTYLIQISKVKDCAINLMCLPDFGNEEFTALIMNNGKVVNDMASLVWEGGGYV